MTKRYIMYGTRTCHYCSLAEQWIKQRGDEVTKFIVGEDISKEDFLEMFGGSTQVPKVLLDGDLIGGYTELTESVNAQLLNG